MQKAHSPLSTGAVLALFLIVIACRLLTGLGGMHEWMPNISPLAAIALCGGIWFSGRFAVGLPLGALFLTDLAMNAHYDAPLLHWEMAPRYVALGGVAALGIALRSRASWAMIIGGSLVSSVLFFVLTNSVSWIVEPGYGKSFAGWLQAMTVGLPGYPPTWVFFRNSVVGDLLFSLLFAVCLHLGAARPQELPVTADARNSQAAH